MKVAILTREFPPDVYGGAGVHVEYLTRELASLRIALREVATRDYVRAELRSLLEDMLEAQEELRSHDRYRITAPLTGTFGEIAPVSIVDISAAGARIAMLHRVLPGSEHQLRFQVDDETGPIDVTASVMWCRPSPIVREHYAGLKIDGEQEALRVAIHRLCKRNEARIDLDSLKRKFDALRLVSGLSERPRKIAV